MIILDCIMDENNNEHNEKWPYIPHPPHRMLIIGASRSVKTHLSPYLIKIKDDIAKIYLYAKDLSKPRYGFLIKKYQNIGIKHLNDSSAFLECSNTMDDVYENIDHYNPSRKRKILLVFDDMIEDIMTNKKFQTIIKELFIRCRKLNTSFAFITQYYFSVLKVVRLKRHII